MQRMHQENKVIKVAKLANIYPRPTQSRNARMSRSIGASTCRVVSSRGSPALHVCAACAVRRPPGYLSVEIAPHSHPFAFKHPKKTRGLFVPQFSKT